MLGLGEGVVKLLLLEGIFGLRAGEGDLSDVIGRAICSCE